MSSLLIQPRKAAPLTGVATRATPSVELTFKTAPDSTVLPPAVTLPLAESKVIVTSELSCTAVQAKLLMTSLFSVLFFAVVITIVTVAFASITLLNVAAPLFATPSIVRLLTLVAAQSNDRLAFPPLVFVISIVAVLALAPIPKKPVLPFALTVIAPPDILSLDEPLTLTVIPSTGLCSARTFAPAPCRLSTS